MLNFTVGPVMSDEDVLAISGCSSPYFRTAEFSKIMLENEEMMLHFLNAPKNSRCVFLTTSGTGAMESCVLNVLNETDKILVVNGGSFGQRFADMCKLHSYEYTEIKLSFGQQITAEMLEQHDNKGYTAFLVNMDETSSGVLYDMETISAFCKRNSILLIVDAISAFLSDSIDMERLNAAAIITGSQKALGVHPGIALVALSPEALDRVSKNNEKCMYLSLKEALKNMERGQTPFTPAVSVLLQIHKRLSNIKASGGVEAEKERIAHIAESFRKQISNLPFEFLISDTKNMSNAVTALRPLNTDAGTIIQHMKDDYNIWLCPNGGEIGKTVFRVGHIGNITDADMAELFSAFNDLQKRNII